jgi:hypothetical protein
LSICLSEERVTKTGWGNPTSVRGAASALSVTSALLDKIHAGPLREPDGDLLDNMRAEAFRKPDDVLGKMGV